MKSTLLILFFTFISFSIVSAQISRDDIIMEWNAGVVGSHNLKTLGSAIPQCCFHQAYSDDILNFTKNFSIAAEFRKWRYSSFKLGLGYSETGRDATIVTSGGIVPTEFTTQGLVGVSSVFISTSYLYFFNLNEKNNILIESGFALHKTDRRLKQYFLNSKPVFVTYLFLTGVRHEFNSQWSASSKLTLNTSLISQDNRDEYQPLSFGLEFSLGYRL